MIWFKRLAPLVLTAIIVVGYWSYHDRRAGRQDAFEQDLALATARIWVASAKHRASPETFLQVRDSILAECSLTVADVREYLSENADEPESFYPYSKLVQRYVDSLIRIEDSLLKAAKDSAP
ncbi:MAG: hypothetical protein JSW34_10835 [Candidatus Zixiibacteriota bacterium]|nr:MAG: hypothetical protein JSW34_10835 [candidate division Zixibacteria bacterium]